MSERLTNPFPGLRPFKYHEFELFFGREEQYEQMIAKLSETRFLAVVGTSGSGKSSLVRAGLLPALYGGQMMSAGPAWRVALFRPKDDPIRELALALNHRRVFGDRSRENGSSLFKLTESINWARLCSRLIEEAKEGRRSPGARILEVLSLDQSSMLEEAARDENLEGRSDVVQTFNQILQQRNFYQASDFQQVSVTGEARDLLSRDRNGLTNEDIERLNRLLLEASYPHEIAKKEEIQAQMAEVILRRGDLGLIEVAREAKMSPEENLLVVVDQFEELFRYAKISEHGRHGNQAAAFVKLLLKAAAAQTEIPIYVVLTMRSDYLGDCARFWDLPEAINKGQYLIPRLTRDQRRDAIRGPIKLRGADITPQLVNQLLNEMGDEPNQLPILQHALMRTWDRWETDHDDHEPIDIRHYVAIGRMEKALSVHADEAYAELPDQRSRDLAEQIFGCLTERESGHRETRRPTSVREIRTVTKAKFKDLVRVINVFRQEGRSFLMPSPKKPLRRETSVDISHESLIANWARLKDWVDREAQSANTYSRLVETSRLHQERKAGLLSDLEVENIQKWKEQGKPNLAWAVRYHPDVQATRKSASGNGKRTPANDKDIFEGAMDFLEQSRLASRKNAQLRKISIVLIAATVFLVFAFLWVIGLMTSISHEKVAKARLAYSAEMNLAQQELENRNFAEVNRLIPPAEDQEAPGVFNPWLRWIFSSADILKQDPSLLGFEWYHVWARSHDELRTLAEYESPVFAVTANSRDNIAILTERGLVELRSTEGELKRSFQEKSNVSAMAMAPEGTSLAVARRDGSIAVWNWSVDQSAEPVSRELTINHTDKSAAVRSIAYSSNGKLLAVGSEDGVVRIWSNTETREPIRIESSLALRATLAPSIAFSKNGRWLAIGVDHILMLVNAITWEKTEADLTAITPDKRDFGEAAPINCLAFSPDSQTIVLGRTDGKITLWDANENKKLVSVPGHSMEVLTVAFSDEDKDTYEFLASGSRDGTIMLWDAKTFSAPAYRNDLRVRNSAERLANSNSGLSVSESQTTLIRLKSDGERLKSDGYIRKELLIATFKGHAGAVTTAAFQRDQRSQRDQREHKILVSGSDDKTVKLWRLGEWPKAIDELGSPGDDGVFTVSLAFSPTSRLLAAQKADGSAEVWNSSDSNKSNPVGPASALAFSPNGRFLATGARDGKVTLWQINSVTGKPENAELLGGHSQQVLTIAFSPDSRVLATGSADKTARLWNVYSKSSSSPFDANDAVLSLDFSSKTNLLAIGTNDGTLILLNWVNEKDQLNWVEGKDRRLKDRHSRPIWSIAFSPNGKIIATGSEDTTARLWAVDSGDELATLQGHSNTVLSLSFSSDGKRLVSGSADGSLKLWDTSYELRERTTSQALMTIREKKGPVVGVKFWPDRNNLAAGYGDGTIVLRYAATPDQVKAQSQHGSKRNRRSV